MDVNFNQREKLPEEPQREREREFLQDFAVRKVSSLGSSRFQE